MEFYLDSSFATDDPFWVGGMPRISVGMGRAPDPDAPAFDVQALCEERLQRWWQRFAGLDGPHWQRWLTEECRFCAPGLPFIDSLEVAGCRVTMHFTTGSEGAEMAPMLVGMLHGAGCTEVECVLLCDEGETVEDDEGELHDIGERYFINEDGQLAVAGYPEIEYVDE